eukprot:526140-Alexandrium_andersonii.AAC.2
MLRPAAMPRPAAARLPSRARQSCQNCQNRRLIHPQSFSVGVEGLAAPFPPATSPGSRSSRRGCGRGAACSGRAASSSRPRPLPLLRQPLCQHQHSRFRMARAYRWFRWNCRCQIPPPA